MKPLIVILALCVSLIGFSSCGKADESHKENRSHVTNASQSSKKKNTPIPLRKLEKRGDLIYYKGKAYSGKASTFKNQKKFDLIFNNGKLVEERLSSTQPVTKKETTRKRTGKKKKSN